MRLSTSEPVDEPDRVERDDHRETGQPDRREGEDGLTRVAGEQVETQPPAEREDHCRQRSHRFSLALLAESAMPGRVIAQCAQEVDAAEGGPVRLGEPHLRICALPQQESAEPLLTRGADDQVRVGLA